MEIKLLTNAEFLEFTKNFGSSSIYQTTNYAFTMHEQGYESMFIGLYDNNQLKAASLVLIQKINGFKYGLVPRGFLIDYSNEELVSNFTKLLKKFLGKRDIVAVKINPMIIRNIYDSGGRTIFNNKLYDTTFQCLTKLGYFHMGYNNNFEALKPRFEAVINLDLNFVQLFGNMNKSTRNKIRKATRDGIKVYHGKREDLEYLYLQTKNKYPRDLEYFKDLYDFFDKDNLIDFYYSKLDTTEYLKYTQNKYNKYFNESEQLSHSLINNGQNTDKIINRKLYVDKNLVKYRNQLAEATEYLKKYPNGIVISSALTIKWKDEVYVVMDGYDNRFKKFGAKQLLFWKIIGRYAKLGYKKLNLGGVSNINQLNNKYKGLNDFKMNFHSNVVEYIGDFELITNNPLYFMYRNSFSITGIFNTKK